MYESFYGLTGKPFSLSPDPRFFYASKGHRRAMAYLEYGIHQEEGFIVITGEVGAGKTTMVRNLFESLSGKPLLAAQLVSTQLDAENLLLSVCLAFGLEKVASDKAGQLSQLELFLRAAAAKGQRALLVVDEVQNLSAEAVEELRMLSNFEGEHGPLLQSFLVGQPEFREMLRSEGMQQLRQRVIANYHLGPMDEPDTRAYVEYRLSRVGWEQDPRLADDVWPMIFRFSGGIPRRINTFCDRLFLSGFLEERHELGPDQVQTLIRDLEQEMGGWMDEGMAAAPGVADTASHAALAQIAEDFHAFDKRLARVERVQLYSYRQIQQIHQSLRNAGHLPDPNPEIPGSDQAKSL